MPEGGGGATLTSLLPRWISTNTNQLQQNHDIAMKLGTAILCLGRSSTQALLTI